MPAIRLLVAIIACLCLIYAESAAAAPRGTSDPGVVPLEENPFHLDEVGLSMQLPAGATVASTVIGGVRQAQIISLNAVWSCNIQTPKSGNEQATIKEAAEKTIALVQGSFGVMDPDQKTVLSTEAKLLDRIPNLRIGNQEAERFYITVPTRSGGQTVKGYTIFKPFGNQFVVFELIAPMEAFAKARREYETSLATARFLAGADINADRGIAIRAGQSLLNSLTTADLDRYADGKERWYRLFRPPIKNADKMSAEELGYRGIKVWKGQRGEVDAGFGGGRGAWGRADRQRGYLASVRARLMTPRGPADSEVVYFLSNDRQEETWVLRMVLRDMEGREMLTAKETGARSEKNLSVVIEQQGQAPRTISPFFESDGYISQLELLVLPRVIVDKNVQSDLAFYAYQSQSEAVSLRRDSPRKTEAPSGLALWEIETTFSSDAPTQTSKYTSAGELLSTSTGDGRVWEPATLDELQKLWEQKGLPTTRPGGRR